MKKILLGFLLLGLISFFSSAYTASAYAAKVGSVEVLYMNHGPLMDTLDRIKAVFSTYGDRIRVSWYDFESREGEEFMAKKGIRQHIPLVIWLDDRVEFRVDGKEIIFAGFPTGSGPQFFQGKWTITDLRKALDQLTGNQ
jgi:hypothetical protein